MKKSNTLKYSIVVILLLTLLVGAALFIANKPTGRAVTHEKVKIGYKATSHYLPVFVAKEKGFFEQEGLNAEIVEFQSSNHVLEGVISGHLDAGRGALVKQFTIELKEPGTLKTFLVNKQTKYNYIDYIIIRKDSNIKSVKELKGKKIGTNAGSVESSFLIAVLGKFGLNKGDYEIITMEPGLLPQVLEAEQIDAFMSYEPITTIAIKKDIGKILVSAPIEKYIIDPLVSGGCYMRADYIEKNPEKAHKIIRAFYKAAEFIENNPEECRKIITKYTPLEEDMSSDLHILEVKKPSVLKDAVQEHADIIFKEGIIDKRLDVSNIFYEIPS